MRTPKFRLLSLVLLALAALPLLGQRASNRLRPSPNASVSQTIGVTEVTLSYSRPGAKGRKVWGELVPYGQLWRTGANEATTISVSKDVLIEGQKLAAGTYALFTLPTENEWTVVFNKNAKLWGTRDYDAAQDALRIKVKPQPADHEEWMSFRFTDLTDSSATLVLRWEKLAVPLKLQEAPAPPAGPAPSEEKKPAAAAESDPRPEGSGVWQFDTGG